MPKTKFRAVTEIVTYDFQGYSQVRIVLAQEGEEFTCETKQMPDNSVSDKYVTFHFNLPIGTRSGESFDTLGRLIACGAIKQIEME